MRYRIYDKLRNEYTNDSDDVWMISANGALYNSVFDEWYEPGNRFIIERYVGHSDVNGNDIFEGDKIDSGEGDGSYYLIEWDNLLSKFVANLYGYGMYFNEGGGEEFDNEISCIDENVIDIIYLSEDRIIGNSCGMFNICEDLNN